MNKPRTTVIKNVQSVVPKEKRHIVVIGSMKIITNTIVARAHFMKGLAQMVLIYVATKIKNLPVFHKMTKIIASWVFAVALVMKHPVPSMMITHAYRPNVADP